MPLITTSFTNRKISYHNIEELIEKIDNLQASEIVDIKIVVPDYTDTKQWASVYYGKIIHVG